MLRFRIFLPTIWYFAKRFIFCFLLFILFSVVVGFRFGSFFPYVPIVLGLFTSFSYELLFCFVVMVVLVVLALLRFSRIVFVFFCISCYYLFIDKVLSGFRILSIAGKLGVGKSLITSFLSLLVAEVNFNEKRFLYLAHYGRQKAENPAPFISEEEAVRFSVIKETVEYYYDNPQLIPELISSYGIHKGNQCSARLNFKHFIQADKLPEGAVIAQDESADVLGNKRCKAQRGSIEYDENILLDETLSKLRHFYDACGIFAEQDNMENHIGLRRVVNANWFLTALSKVCTPTSLIRRAERLKYKVLSKAPYLPYDTFKTNSTWDTFYKSACTLKQVNKYDKLNSRIKKIGFFKINYEQTADKERISSVKVKQCSLLLPINLPFKYETRNQFFENNALDLPLNLSPHTTLYTTNKPTPPKQDI